MATWLGAIAFAAACGGDTSGSGGGEGPQDSSAPAGPRPDGSAVRPVEGPDGAVATDAGTPSPRDGADPFWAFPGALGFGAEALTGCDRSAIRVVPVTSLTNDGPGSLREALTSPDATPNEYRIVTFQTGGTITLTDEIQIRKGCLYVAGQTAPGDGIQLRSPPNDGARLLAIHPSRGLEDVVIRYLRFRSGRGDPGGSGDNITISSGTRLVLDHLSLEWANDEGIGLTSQGGGMPLREVTLQRTIIAEILERHSTGTLFGRSGANAATAADMSMHHNLFAHNRHRNPRITFGERINVIHNVTYNWASRVGRSLGDADLDLIGNTWIPGPLSRTDAWFQHEGWSYPPPSVYWADNQSDRGEIEWDVYIDVRNNDTLVPLSSRRDQPHAPARRPVPVTSAADGYESVLQDVGANARLDCDGQWIAALDRVDAQIIRDVREGTGRGTRAEGDHPDDYGGYPDLSEGTPCPDQDGDGMPDAWESLHGLDPANASDALEDRDGDGYAAIEEFINGTNPVP